ncbi:hypothetical protein [Deinococcus multiflagellatus]|uniref:Uncharacterized protein n=1 Tax=Deinococcus multiflagellatus TaxID=1656887 RepID=A0ABW1ZRW4_9DEIO|nr:hypothetical protein [Deinococcus multiflagellatus]MBZ9715525.1 hypothetical protein [Deinococcus multiflagellatus]
MPTREQLAQRWTTFQIVADPDPACPFCAGHGQIQGPDPYGLRLPCSCVLGWPGTPIMTRCTPAPFIPEDPA